MAPDDQTPPDDRTQSGGPTPPDDPTPDDIDEPERGLLPDDPSEGLGPDAPRVPDPSTNDVPPDLRKQFWSLVLLFNVALFGMSLGLMVIGFQGRWRVGGAFFAVGAIAFLRGWRGYQKATGGDESEPAVGDAEGGDGATGDDETSENDGATRDR